MVKEERDERQYGKPLMMWLNRDEVLETIKNRRRPEVVRIPNFLHFPNQALQNAQQRAMPHDVWTPMITSNPSLRNKSLRARNKVAHVEL